ncbi:hypothetical protein MVEN_01836100 [Mycena venus]|uniref:Uncharacterized protein n=1 Tax=Mycena venus TaxID=2733690 RepID=A0A8H6XL36_9AGAR|nr:hypothetical protein MVEN_01836100 [Mycena venus]
MGRDWNKEAVQEYKVATTNSQCIDIFWFTPSRRVLFNVFSSLFFLKWPRQRCPPTTHALPEAQRRRLMRSTRKLGALLGETPLVVESVSTAPMSWTRRHSHSVSAVAHESKRSGRVYTAESDSLSRTSSLRLAKAPVVAEATSHTDSSLAPPVARPMLYLSLPSSGASSPAERTPLPSPLSPSFISLISPTTPTPTADTTRRRKMAKLVRTLGENVPPELVFPASQPTARRRASTLSVPESKLERRRGADKGGPRVTASSACRRAVLLPIYSAVRPREPLLVRHVLLHCALAFAHDERVHSFVAGVHAPAPPHASDK